MLLRLILLRMSPMIVLKMCKNRKTVKWIVGGLILGYAALGCGTCLQAMVEEQWRGVVLFLVGMIPQYFFYVLALWMMVRCIWSAWSERVWNRIYLIAVIVVFTGILTENYWNPKILQFFVKIFK